MAEHVASFDIYDSSVLLNGTDFLDNLTKDEREEIQNVVTLLESAKEDSMEQFEPLENTTKNSVRHKIVTDSELDRLAGKNSAQATLYQTRWAVVVMKDKYCSNSTFLPREIAQNMTF